MPPRSTPSYTPYLLNLISSTAYPPLPLLEELESLRSSLQIQANNVSADIEKRLRKERKRKERDDGEAAALEANEKAGMKLEALERARAEAALAKKAGVGGSTIKKERASLSPAPSNTSSASFRPATRAQPITYGQQVKKKKKRVMDSDDEAGSQGRDRSTTLASPPPHLTSTSGLKLKLSSSHPNAKGRPQTHANMDASPTPSGSTAAASAAVGSSIDFSLPSQPARPLVPPRPGVQKPFKPGPKRQSEVNDDYSNTKAPNQVLFTSFWSGLEPYLRDIGEDDLAMLGFKADAPESYEMPARGRHYTEVWDEEDGLPPGTSPRVSVPNLRQSTSTPSHGGLPLPHFIPTLEMRDEALVDDHRGLGHLTERVIAAVLGDLETANAMREEVAGKVGDGLAEGQRDPMRVDVVELEERIKRELRAVMLLGEHEEFDSSKRDDDEISTSLRQCQRLLVQQTAVNDARKQRLAEAARRRLAFADYSSTLEGIEKAIEAGWAKRVKKYGIAPKKTAAPGQPVPHRPPVQENLKRLIAVRRTWLDSVGQIMRERPRGEVMGLPTESIYQGIGEESEETDEKAVEDVVEVGSEVEDGESVG